MRLILSGGGNPEDVVPIDKLFLEQIDSQKTILYIPVAMEAHVYSYDECFEWIKSVYKPYGIEKIEMCTELNEIELGSQYTAVFIGGGNTFKLLKEIKESGFDLKLISYLENGGLVYGGSAGAIICGKSIESALFLDKNDIGLTDLSGLNLLDDNDVFCHYNDKSDENDFIKNYSRGLYILYEESGLFVNENTISSIGKEFKQKSDLK